MEVQKEETVATLIKPQDIIFELTWVGANPEWSTQEKNDERSRVMHPFTDWEPGQITKSDVINFLEVNEKSCRKTLYETSYALVEDRIIGTGEKVDQDSRRNFSDGLQTMYDAWQQSQQLLFSAKEDINGSVVRDHLVALANARRGYARELRENTGPYRTTENRPVGNWLEDAGREFMDAAVQEKMANNFATAADLYI